MSKKAGAKRREGRDRVPPGGVDRRAPESSGTPAHSSRTAARGDTPGQSTLAPLPPFKRRRGLFRALLTAFALWVGVLLGLYFFTVYPNRDASPDAPADAAESDPQTVSR